MGWKASCLFASTRGEGFLGTFPNHDSQRAQETIKALGWGKLSSAGIASLEQGIYPEPDSVYIGAYDGAIVLGTEQIAADCLNDRVPPLVERLGTYLPGASMLALVLHSVVNLFGYAYYEQGKLVRVRAGSAEDGIIVDKGEPMPEERPLFARSVVRDGSRVYRQVINGHEEEFPEDAFGEGVTRQALRRPFPI
jgi:hypothetical protein